MPGDAVAVARLGRVLGHETCVRLIDELTNEEATVSELCARLELDQPRVSSHLALLREAGLVSAASRGRQHVYSLNGHTPALALTTLRTLAAGVSPQPAATGGGREDTPIRRARTCYDHLAGTAGVRALDWFLEHGWLTPLPEGRRFQLTAAGESGFEREGVDVGAARRARRAFAIGCDDWTERRFHLGGALGSELLAALLRSGRARLEPGSRVVEMSEVPWPA